jgi:hypothetical protein
MQGRGSRINFFLFGRSGAAKEATFPNVAKGETANLSHHRYFFPPRRRAIRYNDFWLHTHHHFVADDKRQRNLHLARARTHAKNHFRFYP